MIKSSNTNLKSISGSSSKIMKLERQLGNELRTQNKKIESLLKNGASLRYKMVNGKTTVTGNLDNNTFRLIRSMVEPANGVFSIAKNCTRRDSSGCRLWGVGAAGHCFFWCDN